MSVIGEVAGKRVDVHYNLNKCRVGKDPKPGEACWSIRHGGKVVGYASAVLLEDVEFRVQVSGACARSSRTSPASRQILPSALSAGAWATSTSGKA